MLYAEMNPLEEVTERILKTIPVQKSVPKETKQAFIVIGKSGVGKSLLAQKLSTELGCLSLNALQLTEKGTELLPSDLQQVYKNTLAEGKAIKTSNIISLMEECIVRESTKFSGYVLDDIISSSQQVEELPPPTPLESEVDVAEEEQKQQEEAEASNVEPTPPVESNEAASGQVDESGSRPQSGSLEGENGNTEGAEESKATEKPATPAKLPISRLSELDFLDELIVPSSSTEESRLNSARFVNSSDRNVPDFCPIVIYLDLPDSEFKRRRASQRVDPETGVLYPGIQIQKSTVPEEDPNIRAAQANSEEDGDQLLEDEAESPVEENDNEEEPEEPEPEEPVPLIDQINEEPTETPRTKKKGEVRPPKLSNLNKWDPIEQPVLDRLLQRYEDFQENLDEECDYWKTAVEPHLNGIEQRCAKQNDPNTRFHFIKIDASQHPDVVFKDAMVRIEEIGMGTGRKTVSPKILSPPTGKTDTEEIIRLYASSDLETDEPPRELGTWGRYCPITLYKKDQLVLGNLTYCVAYRGLIVFFASQEYMNLFVTNPEKYLNSPTSIPSLRIWVMGGPFSGKTTQASLISKIYNLKYLNIDEILCNWSAEPDQERLLEENGIYKRVVRRASNGKTISAKLIIEIFNQKLQEVHPLQDDIKKNCWIIDGFPKTSEQAKALMNNGFKPHYLILLKNDINDIPIRERADKYVGSSKTGLRMFSRKLEKSPARIEQVEGGDKQVYDPAWVPDLPIQMYPYFDNLYNGFKEDHFEIMKVMEEENVSIIPVASDSTIQTVLSVIQSTIDPFLPRAVTLSSTRIAQLPADPQLGYTKDYCPVSLRKNNILVKGNKSCVVEYRSHIYYLANDEMRIQFISEPHNYLSSNNILSAPPLRLFVVGPESSGKTTCAEFISKISNGIPHVDFEKYLAEHISRLPEADKTEVDNAITETGAPPSYLINELGASFFTQEPYASQGFILENFPPNKNCADYMIKQGLHVDALIYLKVDGDVLATRLNNKRLISEAQKTVNEPGTEEGDHSKYEELMDSIDKQNSRVNDVIASFESNSSLPVHSIDASRFTRVVLSEIKSLLKSNIDYRNSMLANGLALSTEEAKNLLEIGTKRLSHFGRLCPVTLSKSKIVSPSMEGYFPAVFDSYIYFLKTEKYREEFLQNVYTYVNLPAPKEFIHPKVCILGPSKSGKTIAAQRAAKDYGLVYLTVPIIVDAILEGQEDSDLHDGIKTCLLNGEPIPDNLVTLAIKTMTNRALCSAKGWVLDGYPYTLQQARQLESQGILPDVFIELDVSEDEVIARCQKDFEIDQEQKTQRLNIAEVTLLRNEIYNNEIGEIRDLFEQKYANWVRIKKTCSKWATASFVSNILEDTISSHQNYLNLKHKGMAAPAWGCALDISEIEGNLSKFGNYCPVTLLEEEEIVEGHPGTKYTAEFRNVYYRMKDRDALNMFLASPLKYVAGRDLPEIAERVTFEEIKAAFPAELELKGYCPVTFAEGPPGFDSILYGSKDNLVRYKEKFYAMQNERQTQRFMRTPWKYVGLELPKKLPPPKLDMPLSELPMVGYLEQTLGTKMNEALLELGKFKPKYPFKSLKDSACIFLALYMKAYNPNSKNWLRKSYRNKLNSFKDHCELIQYLSRVMEERVYVPPDDRAADFDRKMEAFLSLKT